MAYIRKYIEVKFLDLKPSIIIEGHNRRGAIEEAVNTLRDCGIIDKFPETPEAWAGLGRIRTTRAKPFDQEV